MIAAVLVDFPLLAALWRASWQGALAICLVAAICGLGRRALSANVRCWLWRLAIVRLLIGLAVVGGVAVRMPAAAPAAAPLPAAPAVAFTDAPPAVGQADFVPTAAVSAGSVVPLRAALPVSTARSETLSQASARSLAAAPPVATLAQCVTLLYAAGVLIGVFRWARAAGRTRQILLRATPVSRTDAKALLADVAAQIGLRRAPRLALSDTIESPMYAGRTILLPAAASYTPAELRLILAHEAAHARRHDLPWEALGALTAILFFFHPLVHAARREERLARESAADALALRVTRAAPSEYGHMLLAVAVAPRRGSQAVLAVGASERGALLRRRLVALGDVLSPQSRKLQAMAIAIFVVGAIVAIMPLKTVRATDQANAPGAPPMIAPRTMGVEAPAFPHGTQRLVVTIRDDSGQPVRGASVRLGRAWTSGYVRGVAPIGTATTDAGGKASLSGLPPASYLLSVREPTDRAAPYRREIVVPTGHPEVEVSLVYPSSVRVEGRVVVAHAGQSAAGILVFSDPLTQGGANQGTVTHTTDDGEYVFWLRPGTVRLRVGLESPLLPIEQRRIEPASVTLDVHPGEPARAPDLMTRLAPVLTFTTEAGAPVSGARVRIYPAGRPQVVNSDTDGRVVLQGVSDGAVRTEKDGEIAAGTFHCMPDGSLTLTQNGQTTTYPDGLAVVSLSDHLPAGLMGRVVDPVGSPLARAIVYLTEFTAVPGTSGRQNGAEVRTCRTDADGRFRIPLNVGNEYQDWIYVRKDGFNCVYPVGVTTYRPHLGETRDLGTVALAAADGIITGRIIDASGKAAPGMVVAAKGARTAVSAATTDGDGRFRVANLVPGEPLQIEVYKGEVYDSADPGRQSNNEWYRTGVRAGMSGLVIPLRDADVGKRIAVRAN